MWGSFWSWLFNLFNPNKSKEEKLRGDDTNMEIKAAESIQNGLPDVQSAKSVDEGVNQGVNQVDVDAANPTASASNIISYDPNKSALDNMYDYAVANNSASAYDAFLQNKYGQEMANTAISRAIADAESQGISKYQLFQSGNAAAASPASAGSTFQSYENAMDRRENWNEKKLWAAMTILNTTIHSAMDIVSKFI